MHLFCLNLGCGTHCNVYMYFVDILTGRTQRLSKYILIKNGMYKKQTKKMMLKKYNPTKLMWKEQIKGQCPLSDNVADNS